MKTEVISETIQKFNGVSYYKCGAYFQRRGVRLHRVVWEYHNGKIPDGYDVHHKDKDRTNNDIDNLELLVRSEHQRMHMLQPDRIAQSRIDIKSAIAKAPEWHRSNEGKEWHSKHAKESWKDRKEITYVCSFCGNEFKTRHIYPKGMNHFCHNNCKSAFRRKLIREGVIAK